jgi:hypothetical protein
MFGGAGPSGSRRQRQHTHPLFSQSFSHAWLVSPSSVHAVSSLAAWSLVCRLTSYKARDKLLLLDRRGNSTL